MLQLDVGVHKELHHCSIHSELSMGFDYLFDNYNHYQQFNSMKIQIKNMYYENVLVVESE